MTHALETETIALNHWLYAEGLGLPVDEHALTAHSDTLANLYGQLLDSPDLGLRYFALESWSEARRVLLDYRLNDLRDRHLTVPGLTCSEGPLTWRNWKVFERENDDAAPLAVAFDELLNRSQALAPSLAQRLDSVRADFATRALTPAHTFAFRENIPLESLRPFLLSLGQACRAPFQHAVNQLSHSVFRRPAGPAELHALYLNRMYELHAPVFGAQPETQTAGRIVRAAQSAFHRLGFDLTHIPVDIENRPRKYPGAFCFPIATPADVRVSVRLASPPHLVDMLYHEFGHAVHFSGIRADLPFIDRYWIHSGVHETFSTLFESLLHDPVFLREQFGFDDTASEQLVEFGRFKLLLTGTWLNASALTALDAWLEGLTWPQIETRYAEHFLAFTGLPIPGGLARLEPFIASTSIYPAGYVLAMVRVAHWLKRLRALSGAAWWQSPEARAEVWERVKAGGAVRFPAEWLEVNANFFSTDGTN